jgi:hypothetical protein
MLYKFYFTWFELISLIMALLFIPKQQRSYMLWFIPFLLATNLVEWGSGWGWYSINGPNPGNNWIDNLFTNIEFVFYSYLFSKFTTDPHHRRRIWICLSCYLPLAVINIFLIQGWNSFHSYTFLLGSLMMIYFSCIYYLGLFRIQTYINLIRYPSFWIVSGLLFYYCGMFCWNTFFEAYGKLYILEYIQLFYIITNIFNILLYTCFSIAFICLRSNQK